MRPWSDQRAFRIGLVVVLVLATIASFAPSGGALAAANLSETMVRISNMTAGGYSSGSVCVQPTTTESGANDSDYVLVTFPTNMTVSSTTGNWTTATSAPSSPGTGSNYWPSGALGWPTALTATNVTGQTVTFQDTTAQALSTSHLYCFDWTNSTSALMVGVATATEEGSVTLENSATTALDTGNYAVSVLTGGNQIVINATVPPIFEFALSGNTDGFGGNLSTSLVNSTTGVTATVTTNAKGGWVMWAEDSNQGLRSTTAGHTIGSVPWNSDAPSTLTAGTEGYALSVTKQPAATQYCSTSGLSVSPEYDTVGLGGTGGDLTANFTEIGQCTGGVSDGDGLKLIENATISVVTPAATDYTDTVTVVGAGSF